MKQRITLSLTVKELELLRVILGFVEAGEVSGGPLDAETPQQRSANLRVFGSLCDRVSEADKNEVNRITIARSGPRNPDSDHGSCPARRQPSGVSEWD